MKDINKAVKILNEVLKADRPTVTCLLRTSEICTNKLANHPHVIVSQPIKDDPRCTVSGFGLLNGIIHAITGERMAVITEGKKVIKFIVYKPKQKSKIKTK